MSGLKMGAILLVVLGSAELAYGRFSFTKDARNPIFGPFSHTSPDPTTIAIPIWGAAGVVILGSLVLMAIKRDDAAGLTQHST